MSSPTNVIFSDFLPASKPDAINVEWQGDVPVPDPNSPGNLVRNVSACYRVPQVGGVFIVTADYQLSDVDSGFTFICNSPTPITVTLPASIPVLPLGEGVWNVKLKNLGTGSVSLAPSVGLLLDGGSIPLAFAQNSGCDVSTDGVGFWTSANFSGASGGSSLSTASLFADSEVPSGAINGSNTAFSLAQTPSPSASLELYLNGDLLKPGTDYTLSGSSITMTSAPTTGDILLAFYRYAGQTGFADDETPSGAINSSNVSFTLAQTPAPTISLKLFLNGLLLELASLDYSIVGAAITMASAPTTGDILLAFYRFSAPTTFNFADAEVPSGTINGSNTAFTLSFSPLPSGSLKLFLNGMLLKRGTDYTLSGTSISMTTAPLSGDKLYAFYRY